MKELKVINVPSIGKCGWGGGAYTIAFVYSKYNGNFIAKGYYSEVKKYIEERYTHFFVNYTFWSKSLIGKGFMSYWKFWKYPYYICKLDGSSPIDPKNKKWALKNSKTKTYIYFKRLPKRWIKDFDNL